MGANVFRLRPTRKHGIAAPMSYRCITVDSMTSMTTRTPTDAREERGRQLARRATISQVGGRWVVPSQTQPAERYLVDVAGAACTRPDYAERRGTCKHQHAVLFWIAWGRDVDADGGVTETVTVKVRRKTYPQKDWSAYNASQVHQREYVERLLRDLCAGIPQPARKPGAGRPPYPLSDAAFAAIMKVYTTLPCRLAEFDLHEAAARGHLGTVGHYNFVQVFLRQPSTTALLESLVEQSAMPLRVIEDGQYAIDSTGFSTVLYDRWFDQKHGKLHAQHPWVKLHVMAGTVTHGITSAQVTSESDDSQLPRLLERTRVHHDVRELSADKAYSTHDNHDVLDRLGVAAYIPFKDNAVVNLKFPVWSRHLCEFLLHQERFLPHYHRRSNVETVFAMIKAKFGGAVLSRRPVAQINEVLAKCVAHNLCCVVKAIFTAGLAPTFWSDAIVAPVGEPS
jgi:transposase